MTAGAKVGALLRPAAPVAVTRFVKTATAEQWKNAVVRSAGLVEAALKGVDESDPYAYAVAGLVVRALDLSGEALHQCIADPLGAPAAIRRQTTATLNHLAEGLRLDYAQRDRARDEAQAEAERQRRLAEQAQAAEQARAQAEIEAERARLQDAHDMALRGAEAAQQEATALRRELDAARREHADAARRKDAEIARLEGLLRQERAATIERDRNHRNEVHQLRHDLGNARTTVGHLNTECGRLEALLADATAPTPQESPMTTNPLLAAHSLAAFLIAEGHPARVTGHEVGLPGGAPLPADLCQRWGAAYPTDAARLAHLRGVVRPLLGRAA